MSAATVRADAPGEALAEAFALAEAGDWEAAEARAAADGRVARDLIRWTRLRAAKGEFPQYVDFVTRNPHWPGLKLMRRQGEALIPEDAAPEDVLSYFGDEPPQTGTGALRLIEAYRQLGRMGDAEAEAVRAWLALGMTGEEQAAFRAGHAAWLKPHDIARLDRLLWAGETEAAERMLALVPEDWQALARARIALRRGARGVDALIAAVPAALRDHPGLAYERFLWRARKGRDAAAIELLLEQSRSAAGLGEAERWAPRRQVYARERMRAGAAETAYELASRHGLVEGSAYADLEWLSGYIALTYLGDPALARAHFRNFRTAVWTPISLGRAGYWLGRAEEALGNSDAAEAAYRFAARYQTSFYGLLAAEKLGLPMDPRLVSPPPAPDWHGMSFAEDDSAVAARLLLAAGRRLRAGQFISHLAETVPEAEFRGFVAMLEEMGDPWLVVIAGKQAARRGMVVPEAYFAEVDLGLAHSPVPLELALAIARRESEFNEEVVSPVGARGLMQLMPGTARLMADKLGEEYDLAALTADPAYNARLGTAYLEKLIEEFGQAITLVSAGYNAGPGRPRQWIERFGDPRADDIDPVDWIEHIPFTETRNYVMRVAEAMVIYRARLAGAPQPIRLTDLLKGR
ncbi:MAG: lytic transglycosylase domain-containing protein [Alphaproteobacteria bacterium]|nr:MAG: lytic transglycosylase domain-containing protein [Alphaproteobacteria bacterium]